MHSAAGLVAMSLRRWLSVAGSSSGALPNETSDQVRCKLAIDFSCS